MIQFNINDLKEAIENAVKEAIKKEIAIKSDAPQQETQKNVLTVKEAAEFLDVSVSHLYKLTSNREIPHSKRGRLYFNREDLEQWIAEGKRS